MSKRGTGVIDLTDHRYGRLTVLRRNGWLFKARHVAWLCRCDCGNETTAAGNSLRTGNTLSCGCLISEHITHISAKHAGSGTRLYRTWKSIHRRCENPNTPDWPLYGGRGIRVCDEWSEFPPFRDWALANGYADNLSIDRIDNDLGYAPANCRWATPAIQRNNQRSMK